MGMTRDVGVHPAQLLKLTVSKFSHSFYMVITLQNLKLLISLLFLSHSTLSKFYQLAIWNLFALVIKFFFFFLEIIRNYASIIITTINNISLLVPRSVICFGYFMPMSYGVNKRAPTIVSPHTPSPNQVFTGFFHCITRNTLSIFFLL